MALPRLILHKDEVNILFEPQERQAPLPSVFLISKKKVAPISLGQSGDIESPQQVKPRSKLLLEPIKKIEQIATEFVSLPHTANHSFVSLTFLMAGILFGSAFLNMWIFTVPFNSVNAGLDENRIFFYGILSYSEFISLIPWIETINYAMPEAKLPVRSRTLAVLAGFMAQKLLDAFIAEGWWNTEHETFFPIPFSTIATEFLAVPVALATLFALHRNAFQGKLLKCCWILAMYLFSLFVAGSWAACFNRLRGSNWQKAWALAFGPLRFLVKILCVARTAVEINSKRWIFLTMIVDLIFARIQVGTLPFIDDWLTMLALLGGSFGTLIWRYYSGIDRFQILCCPYWKRVKGDVSAIDTLHATYGESTFDIFFGVGRASLKDIHDATARSMQKEGSSRFSSSSSNVALDPTMSAVSVSMVPEESFQSAMPIDCTICRTILIGDAIGLSGRLSVIDEGQESDEESSQLSISTLVDFEEETVSVGSHESTDTLIEISLETDENEITGKSSSEVATGAAEDQTIDRRAHFANTKAARIPSEKLLEEIWFQRQFYHIVDSLGSEILGLIVLMQHLGALWLTRKFPIHRHLNATFDISAEEWMRARVFGISSVVGDIVIIASLTVLFRRVKERQLTMSRVLSYIFRNNFWFIFLWVTATGAYSCATMINHFGADFTLNITWRHCRATMAWPSCI